MEGEIIKFSEAYAKGYAQRACLINAHSTLQQKLNDMFCCVNQYIAYKISDINLRSSYNNYRSFISLLWGSFLFCEVELNGLNWIELNYRFSLKNTLNFQQYLNPFVPNALFLYPLKRQKTLRFSDVFRS